MTNIRGLTLIRPWPYAIINCGKPLENRSWIPGPNQLRKGDWIALHAGKKWDKDAAYWILNTIGERVPSEDKHTQGAIVALLRYNGYITESKSPWFFGPYGWTWSEMFVITPIPHKGAQGLWTLEPEAMEKIEEILGQEAK